jgi:hypothetical protein
MAWKDYIGSFNKFNFDDLYNTYLSLEKKQQMLVSAVVVVVIFLVLLLPVSCVSSKLSAKKQIYEKERDTAAEFYRVLDDYAQLVGQFGQKNQSETSMGGDPLKTVLYQVTDEMQIERQRVSPKTMSPVEGDLFTEVGKDVTIRNIRIDQAIKLISQLVQNPDLPVSIKKASLQVDARNKANIKTLSFSMTTLQMTNQRPLNGGEEPEKRVDRKAKE